MPSDWRLRREILDRMLRGEKLSGRKHSIEPLGVRKRVSTDVLAVGDRHVADAVAFIRNNAHKNIRVEDLLGSVPLSRRVLETRFRKALNRTPHQEILRVRTNAVRELLSKPTCHCPRSARLSASSTRNISVCFFKKETGLTPREYRDRVRARSLPKDGRLTRREIGSDREISQKSRANAHWPSPA